MGKIISEHNTPWWPCLWANERILYRFHCGYNHDNWGQMKNKTPPQQSRAYVSEIYDKLILLFRIIQSLNFQSANFCDGWRGRNLNSAFTNHWKVGHENVWLPYTLYGYLLWHCCHTAGDKSTTTTTGDEEGIYLQESYVCTTSSTVRIVTSIW